MKEAADKRRGETERALQSDPLRCADQDTCNLIYRGGNSSEFPGF